MRPEPVPEPEPHPEPQPFLRTPNPELGPSPNPSPNPRRLVDEVAAEREAPRHPNTLRLTLTPNPNA